MPSNVPYTLHFGMFFVFLIIGSSQADDTAILRQYPATQARASTANFSSWTSNAVCNGSSSAWDGVRCTNGRVTQLQLSSAGLVGTLPAAWSNLTSLEHLDVSNNSLTGSLPEEWSQLTVLYELSAQLNNLTGSVPAAYSNLTKLWSVKLAHNSLNGTLPSTWSQMASLQTLDVSTNSFSGTLPASWALLPKLAQLNVSAAPIHGPLPRSWLSPDLYTLDFSWNQLTGTLDLDGSFRRVQVFDGSSNRFNGTLPAAFIGNLTNTISLSLANNRLEGSLPPLGTLFHGISLDLSNNLLTGALPEDINPMMLNLSNCNFSGSLPASWGKPERTLTSDAFNSTGNNFWFLDLANNSLKGTLPAEWAGMDMLTYLSLSTNYLSGTLPPEYVGMKMLAQAFLHANNFTGTLPADYAKLDTLNYLDVHNNYLTGQLPSAWFTKNAFSRDTFLEVHMNNLSGPLPPVTRDCPLCNARNATDPSSGGSSGSALTIAPMRAGYGICGDIPAGLSVAGVNASSAAVQQPRQAYNYGSLDQQLPLTTLPPCKGAPSS